MTVRADTSETAPVRAQKDDIRSSSEVPLDHTVESQVVLFRREISLAIQQGYISETEAERWIQQGVEKIVRSEKDPAEMQKQIAELQTYLHKHIAIHQENSALRQRLEERIDQSGVFDVSSRQQWLSAIDYAQERYQAGEISLKQCQIEIKSVVDSLPQFIRSGHKNAEDYRKLWEAVTKSDLPMVTIERNQIPDLGRFLQLPYPSRVEHVKKLREQIAGEATHFISRFSEYARQVDAKGKLDGAKSTVQKLAILAGLYRNLGNSEKKRLEEKAEIVTLMNGKTWSLAREKMALLHKKLNEKTLQFYGFDALEQKIQERWDAREKLLQQAGGQQQQEEWEKAIVSLEEAHAIEALPTFSAQVAALQKRLEAARLLQQAGVLAAQQNEEEARKLQEQALALDPALTQRLVVPRTTEDSQKKKEEVAREEWRQKVATDETVRTLRAESLLIQEVKSKKEEAGTETVSEESGSVAKRSLRGITDGSEKLKVQKEVVNKTKSLDRDQASDATLVSLHMKKMNREENISRTLKDIQEGRRHVGTVSFQQGDEVSEDVSLEKAQRLQKEKITVWYQENIALIGEKYGVRLTAPKSEFELAA